jgi:hypothetical protein
MFDRILFSPGMTTLAELCSMEHRHWRSHGKPHGCRLVAALVWGFLAVASPTFGSDDDTAPRFVIELEGGPVWQSENDVQIPNDDDGTRFSLPDVIGNGPWGAYRLCVTWNISSRHSIRALAAPLSITDTGELPSTIDFAGGIFGPDVPTEATYKFNSWRLSYRYRFHNGSRWAWWIGFTAKVRDAKIELEQDGNSAKKTDVGFVPLLHVEGLYRFSERWRVVFDLDGIAGGPGRAEDASLKVYADINHRWSVSAGYRTVEGGADVDEVYNFAWLNYAVVSGCFNF